jgi:hypothetical protein
LARRLKADVAMPRRAPPPPGPIAPIGELADVLEPDAPPRDFAFADTVIVGDDLLPPASGPMLWTGPDGDPQRATPLAFPLPPAAPDTDLGTRMRVAWAHVRHGLQAAREEIGELWASTEANAAGTRPEGAVEAAGLWLRRVAALWAYWHWNRTDVVRAAMIGIAVFLAAATFGASTFADDARATASSTSDDVRPPRTLDQQHTGYVDATRLKAKSR